MADSTTNLPQLSSSQANLALRINELIDALSPASPGGRDYTTSTGLTWGYLGGKFLVNGVPTNVINGTVALPASVTRYLERSRTGAITLASARSADKEPLFAIVTNSTGLASYTDERTPQAQTRVGWGRVTIAMANANQTLTQPQALCESITLTGALTALRDVIVPTVQRPYWIFANVTGGFGVRVKTSAGTGITIADGKRAIVECDGTNVVRVTADV